MKSRSSSRVFILFIAMLLVRETEGLPSRQGLAPLQLNPVPIPKGGPCSFNTTPILGNRHTLSGKPIIHCSNIAVHDHTKLPVQTSIGSYVAKQRMVRCVRVSTKGASIKNLRKCMTASHTIARIPQTLYISHEKRLVSSKYALLCPTRHMGIETSRQQQLTFGRP